jgi:hypothetical protein
MKGYIEVTVKDGDGTKQLVNLDHLRVVRVQGRGDRAATMIEMAGDGQRWLIAESYGEVRGLIAGATAIASAVPPQKVKP